MGADERAAVGREPHTDIVLVLSEFHLPQTHHLFPSPPLTPSSVFCLARLLLLDPWFDVFCDVYYFSIGMKTTATATTAS